MASRAAAVLALLLAALTGCASIPTAGPVVAGPPVEGDVETNLRFQPISPPAGASPRAVVQGFLLAAAGPEDDHAFARAYLSPAVADAWRPGTGTAVYDGSTLDLGLAQAGEDLAEGEEPAPDGGEVTVTLSARVLATVDAGGRYTAQPPGTSGQVAYTVARSRGEWRISSLPHGLLVDEAGFDLAFSSYQLYFVDPTASFLVPETRWFPDRRSVATTLASQLLRGPSQWLRDAVTTGFPDGAQLTAPAAVTVVDGEAQVDVTRSALRASADERALMQAQLQATLRPVRAISSVRMTVEGSQLVLPRTVPPLVRAPAVDPVPVAVAGGTLVALRDGALLPVEGVPQLQDVEISDPAKGPASYAVLAQDRRQLLHVVPGSPAAPAPLLEGTDLTAPSIDSRSWVWSTSALSSGTVTAVRPGTGAAEVEAPWLEGRRISSLRVSGDATRVVVTSAAADGRPLVDLAGVVRAADGRPVALVPASHASLLPDLVEVREAVWAGEATIAVLGRAGDQEQPAVWVSGVLGPTGPPLAPPPVDAPARDVAAGDGERSLLLTTADGRLWQRAGTQWLDVESDVAVSDPAFAG